MDWKETLAALRAADPETPSPKKESAPAPSPEKHKSLGKVNIAIEKKGRGGKTATIIYDFEIPEEQILDVARTLKQRLGIGGSARGGEILLQGDCREKAASILRELGFKAK